MRLPYPMFRIFFVLFFLLAALLPESSSVRAQGVRDPRGIYWPNYVIWLDHMGVFPDKSWHDQGMSDHDLFNMLIERARISNPKTIVLIVSSYHDQPERNLWLAVQADRVRYIHEAFPGARMFLRPIHTPYVDIDEEEGLRRAEYFARDYALVINQAAAFVEPSIILGNEPDSLGEGWNQDPAYFNLWFKSAVWYFWNVYRIPRIQIFYPGLSRSTYDAAVWYAHPSTKENLRWWAHGISFHVYWQTGDVGHPDAGNYYKKAWAQVRLINPRLSVLIGEWGNASSADMDTVKIQEYVVWLQKLAGESSVPVVGTALFILHGTPDWRHFFLTDNALRTIGSLF